METDGTSERDCANSSCAPSSLGSQSVVSGSDSAFGKGSAQLLNVLGIPGRTNSVAQAPPGDVSNSKRRATTPSSGNGATVPSYENHTVSSDESPHGKRRPFGGIVSKLKCCRSKENDEAPPRRTPFATLSEDQALEWSSFDVRSIAEDQTTISGRSTVVSMSAPLLTTRQYRPQASEAAFEI